MSASVHLGTAWAFVHLGTASSFLLLGTVCFHVGERGHLRIGECMACFIDEDEWVKLDFRGAVGIEIDSVSRILLTPFSSMPTESIAKVNRSLCVPVPGMTSTTFEPFNIPSLYMWLVIENCIPHSTLHYR